MAWIDKLRLYEALLLLGLEEDGTWIATNLDVVIAAGVLADLALEGRIEADGSGGMRIPTRGAVDDPILDRSLKRLSRLGGADARPWLLALVGDELAHRAAEALCERGLLQRRTKRVLLFFRHTFHVQADATPRRELRAHLDRVLEQHGPVDRFTALLVSVADATGLLRCVLDRETWRASGPRIEGIRAQEGLGETVTVVNDQILAAWSQAASEHEAATSYAVFSDIR